MDSPEPRKSKFKPDEDIEIKFAGLRPGEKLHEELITEGEGIIRTPYDKIFVLKGDTCDFNWFNQKIKDWLDSPTSRMSLVLDPNSKRSSPNTNPSNPKDISDLRFQISDFKLQNPKIQKYLKFQLVNPSTLSWEGKVSS